MEILLSICSKTDGSVRDVRCELGERLLMGRGAEDGILLDGPDLSREHLALAAEGTTIYVTDLSANGTWLNGKRLRKGAPSKVQPEDSIEVPEYVLKVRVLERPEEARADNAATPIPMPAADQRAVARPPQPSKGIPVLSPVLRFAGSFTLTEKFLILTGLSGLLLLYTYVAA